MDEAEYDRQALHDEQMAFRRDALRYRAMDKVWRAVIFPCRPPLASGGWHVRLRGTWGSCGVYGVTLEQFVDRVMAKMKEHPSDCEPDLKDIRPVDRTTKEKS
jgi:hypothetical protein